MNSGDGELFQAIRSGDLAEVKAIIRHAIYTNSMNYLRTTYTYLDSWGWGDKMPPLHYACRTCKNPKIVEFMMNFFDVNEDVIDDHGRGMTPLWHACYNENPQIIKTVLENKSVNLHKKPKWRLSPLIHHAITHTFTKNLGAIKVLLASGKFDVNEGNSYKETPLHLACKMRGEDLVRLLLRCKQINVNKRDIRGLTPLLVASRNRRNGIVKLLLERPDIDISIRSKSGKNVASITRSAAVKTTLKKHVRKATDSLSKVFLSKGFPKRLASNLAIRTTMKNKVMKSVINGRTTKVTINPLTGRRIRIGGSVHRTLVRDGTLSR